MENKVILHVVPMEVGVEYVPGSQEAEPMDQLRSMEFGLHALAGQVVAMRQQLGLRVPGIYMGSPHETKRITR